jgi:hypothetical protein
MSMVATTVEDFVTNLSQTDLEWFSNHTELFLVYLKRQVVVP